MASLLPGAASSSLRLTSCTGSDRWSPLDALPSLLVPAYPRHTTTHRRIPRVSSSAQESNATCDAATCNSHGAPQPTVSRRQILWMPSLPVVAAAVTSAAAVNLAALGLDAQAADEGAPPSNYTDMPALRGKDYGKTRVKYPDYIETSSGLQYKDLKEGSGPAPNPGDTVVIDWDGFTIGYYGRIFEARNKAKGGSFEGGEKDFFRFRLGAGEVIPAFEEAIQGMQVGMIRRIVVPPELGYPNNDFNQKGPRPITFSGQRALDFVLKNQGLIDKTLLFDIELLRIVPS